MTTGLAQELYDAHSPGNRFVYYPATKAWNNAPMPSVTQLAPTGYGHLYIHIPYCRSLCTFCGCNIKIDQNADEHLRYVSALKKELSLKDPDRLTRSLVKSLTLGGGSPNALDLKALESLVTFIVESFPTIEEVLIEVDPLTLNHNQLELLTSLAQEKKAIRFSMGVQDFSESICVNVNRHQSEDSIINAFELIGEHHQKNIDLIWGLPLQNVDSIKNWRSSLEKLAPDSVSFYPLAKVPWLAPYQEAYGNFETPALEVKYQLFEAGHSLLGDLEYEHFAFGHYLKKEKTLHQAWKRQSIFRSVSGLYLNPQDFSLGLGVGAISSFENYYHQNERVLEKYKYSVLDKDSAIGYRSHEKNSGEKSFMTEVEQIIYHNKLPHNLKDLPEDWMESGSKLSSKGRLFLKNILQRLEKGHFS